MAEFPPAVAAVIKGNMTRGESRSGDKEGDTVVAADEGEALQFGEIDLIVACAEEGFGAALSHIDDGGNLVGKDAAEKLDFQVNPCPTHRSTVVPTAQRKSIFLHK